MKKILCFGDSNTWGYMPDGKGRYNEQQRWPMLMADMLGDDYKIVEEGQLGRTLSGLQPIEQNFLPIIHHHQPDLLVVMLGTNDLQSRLNLSTLQIAQAAGALVKAAKLSLANLPMLLVAPPPVTEGGFFCAGYQGAALKSQDFAQHFLEQAEAQGCAFFDAGKVVSSSLSEGVHWPVEQHLNMAKAMCKQVSKYL